MFVAFVVAPDEEFSPPPDFEDDYSPQSAGQLSDKKVGFVYVGRSGLVRIGKATDEKRYKSYHSSLPNGWETLRVWELRLPLVAEQWLHRRYARYRVRGSWYELPPDKLKELLSTTDFPKPSVLIRIHI